MQLIIFTWPCGSNGIQWCVNKQQTISFPIKHEMVSKSPPQSKCRKDATPWVTVQLQAGINSQDYVSVSTCFWMEQVCGGQGHFNLPFVCSSSSSACVGSFCMLLASSHWKDEDRRRRGGLLPLRCEGVLVLQVSAAWLAILCLF